jgi:AraC-like DNA-binding protein
MAHVSPELNKFPHFYIWESGILTSNMQKLEFILQNANHKPGCILKNIVDKQVVKPLVDAIIREYDTRDIYNQELIQLRQYHDRFGSRNIAEFLHLELSESTDQRAANILKLIKANIYQPDKIRADYLCKQFIVSINYLGKYFKQHTGSTLQRYITQYRQTLIEHRLIHSDKRLGEIVDEFGFTDESHLNKFFRNNKGISPKAFRTKNSIRLSALVN